MRFGLKQTAISVGVFAFLLLILISLDERVRDRASEVVADVSVTSWSSRASVLGNSLIDAAEHQSIENAPLLIFATVGTVLFLFMVRT